MSTSSHDTTSFTRFPQLPLELRKQIWECLFEPRIVCIKQFILPTLLQHRSLLSHGIRANSPSPQPILLVNREAYNVWNKYYGLAFATNAGGAATVPFDFKRDTLYIDMETFGWDCGPLSGLKNIVPEDLARVENLAIGTWSYSLDRIRNPVERCIADILGSFGGVRNLHAVIQHARSQLYERNYTLDMQLKVFIDPKANKETDVDDALYKYGRTGYKSWKDAPPLKAEKISNCLIKDHKINMNDLEAQRLRWNAMAVDSPGSDYADTESAIPGVKPHVKKAWEMPHISYKVLLSAGLKIKLEDLRTLYYAAIEENIRKHELHKDGECQCGRLAVQDTAYVDYILY